MSVYQDLEKQSQQLLVQFQTELKKIDLNSEKKISALNTKYLGKKGLFNQLAAHIKDLKKEEKKDFGQTLKHLKDELERCLNELKKKKDEGQQHLDLSLPGIKQKIGHLHPVTQAIEEISQIFERIGFVRANYPEVDWDYYVFGALNMPANHPARDEWETFFVDQTADPKLGKVVLTTHTSNGQVREMERVKGQLPIRMINISRCYRRQSDVTHTQMFHQFEGLVIDDNINIQHLKGTIDYFAKEFFGPKTKSRIRPFHFKFTEPSFEVDFSCQICGGTGYLKKKNHQKESCRFCKSGWHEVGGAGMVHPNVLEAGGVDSKKYRGFAFGWGVERSYTLKQGLNIDDIRLFYSGEREFLEQF
jgi:phenylalanyl-tRNA synthetase alpha chain